MMLTALLVMPLAVNAQTSNVAMHFAEYPMGAVESGLGGIELIEEASFVSAGYMTYSMSDSPTSYFSVRSKYELTERMRLSGYAVYGICEEYETVNQSGIPTGTFSPGQLIVCGGFEYGFTDYLNAGVKVKYMKETLSQQASYSAAASDIYAIGDFLLSMQSSVSVGLKISNLGTKVRSVSGDKFSLPSAIKANAAYSFDFYKGNIKLVAESDYYFHGCIAAGAGAAYTYNDMLSVRAGYHCGGQSVVPSFASAGLGLKFWGAKIDLAYIFANEIMNNTLAVSLGYSF